MADGITWTYAGLVLIEKTFQWNLNDARKLIWIYLENVMQFIKATMC